MKQNTITIRDNAVINLGYVADDSSTIIRLPISSFVLRYGDGGEFRLIHRLPGEQHGHPVSNITVRNGCLEWLVGAEELSTYGDGEAQVEYVCEDGVAHTKIWKTLICRSLDDTADIPEQWRPWIDKLYEIERHTKEYASHYPRIDAQTGTWMIWNADTDTWEDSGIDALMPDMLPPGGDPGQVLTKTDDGYEWMDPTGASDWVGISGKPFESIDHNQFAVNGGVLSINTTDDAIEGSTQPITSSGVYTIVGNIDVLLSLI